MINADKKKEKKAKLLTRPLLRDNNCKNLCISFKSSVYLLTLAFSRLFFTLQSITIFC